MQTPIKQQVEQQPPAIEIDSLEVVYGTVAQALFGVSLKVPAGSIVTLLGPNGSGKTTLIRAVTGLLGFQSGRITAGNISLFDVPAKRRSPQKIVRMGISHIPEGRGTMAELTVEENLKVGGIAAPKDAPRTESQALEYVYDMFPVLRQRAKGLAGYLSGGEQQMLAMGRALMSSPRLIIMDEPSLGLAPIIVQQIQELIVEINQTGTTVLLVEQNVAMALEISNAGYVLERGKVAKSGAASELKEDEEVKKLYLGVKSKGEAMKAKQ